MSADQKKKLCWNCEGSVSVAEETCPYCGVSVIPASLDGPINYGNSQFGQVNKGSNYLHTPSYQMDPAEESSVPRPPYGSHSGQPDSNAGIVKEAVIEVEESEVPVDEFKNILLSMLLMLAGSMFFLFGLTLVLFSHHGTFTLQWDGSYWFVYSAISLPLLFFGWRALLRLDEEE